MSSIVNKYKILKPFCLAGIIAGSNPSTGFKDPLSDKTPKNTICQEVNS